MPVSKKKFAGMILLSLFLFAAYLLVSFLYIRRINRPVKADGAQNKSIVITGHRGAAGLAPENTLAAIQKALDLKVDEIEIDIQQTQDSVLVVLHDKECDRTTDGTGLVKEQNYEELRQYNAGLGFGAAYQNEKIPRLEDVLKLIDGRARLLIEIKAGGEYYPGIEQRTLDLIETFKAESWCSIISFNDRVLEEVHRLNPQTPLMKLFVGKLPFLPFHFDQRPGWGGLNTFDYVDKIGVNYRFVDRQSVEKAHRSGKKIKVWTVNDPVQMQRLLQLGVDGIVTDYPDKLLKIHADQNAEK